MADTTEQLLEASKDSIRKSCASDASELQGLAIASRWTFPRKAEVGEDGSKFISNPKKGFLISPDCAFHLYNFGDYGGCSGFVFTLQVGPHCGVSGRVGRVWSLGHENHPWHNF